MSPPPLVPVVPVVLVGAAAAVVLVGAAITAVSVGAAITAVSVGAAGAVVAVGGAGAVVGVASAPQPASTIASTVNSDRMCNQDFMLCFTSFLLLVVGVPVPVCGAVPTSGLK